MIYVVKKFRRDLLGNKFEFVVDHHVLLHLVNQPAINGQIARWVMILKEYNFEVVDYLS